MDKQEYLDPEDFPETEGGEKVTPGEEPWRNNLYQAVSSCLFYSSEAGMGCIDCLINGRWAGNRLAVLDKIEPGWKNIGKQVKQLVRLANIEG